MVNATPDGGSERIHSVLVLYLKQIILKALNCNCHKNTNLSNNITIAKDAIFGRLLYFRRRGSAHELICMKIIGFAR